MNTAKTAILTLSTLAATVAALNLFGDGGGGVPRIDPVDAVVSATEAGDASQAATVEPQRTREPQLRRPAASGAWSAPRGRSFRLRITSDSTAKIVKNSGALPQQITQQLAAVLECQVRDRRGDELVVAMQLVDPQVRIQGQGSADSAVVREFAALLAGESLVRMRDDGTTLGYRFPAGMAEVHKQCLRGLVDAMRHVLPADRDTAWETEEASAHACARVAYVSRAGRRDREQVLQRRVLGLAVAAGARRPWSSRGTGRADSVFDGELGWLASTDARLSLTVTVPQLNCGIVTVTDTAIRLESSDDGAVPADRRVDWSAPWEPVTSAQDPRRMGRSSFEQRYRKSLAGRSADDFVRTIASLVASRTGLQSSELRMAMKQLKWLLRVDPAQVAVLRQALLANADAPVMASILANALVAAGTPACQEVLCDLLADAQGSPEFRQTLARAMLYLAAPTERSLRTAGAFAAASDRDSSKVGLVLYGALVLQVGADSGHVARLAAMEAHARRLGCVPEWLLALGNARQPALDRITARHLAARDIDTRRAAIQALTHVRTPAMTERLRRLLADESVAELKTLLVEELALRGDTVTILDRLRHAADRDVRRSALIAAGRLQADPAVRDAILAVARSDRSAELRRLAQTIASGV